MVDINWCLKQKQGIKLIEPNENLARAYLEMANEALTVMNNEKTKSLRWTISSCYYSMYYSLYSVLQKIGIKSEIHSCSLELIRFCLLDFYSIGDYRLIGKAFECRNIVQYYVDKIVDKKDSDMVILRAPDFVKKSKQILLKLNQDDINKIRNYLASH